MARVYNFSAGPAVLPEEVLKEAAAEMMDYQGSGQSVMEMSHRSKVYLIRFLCLSVERWLSSRKPEAGCLLIWTYRCRGVSE